jgi:hypothetical protein
VYAICAQKPAGYWIVTSSTIDSGAPDTVNAGTVRPAGSVVVSGGVLPSSPSPLVWLGGLAFKAVCAA